ncbi:LamG-like jellyroll fold domain-containing protein [Demequina sp. SO4-18]|uniref:LamG-like jellyroll fold domain-containing protein n=1 Tax=Demequina sp. SO4-18 TaxID=3401026 RepID=UPI003B5AD646
MDGRVSRKVVAAIASISVLGTAAVTAVGSAAAADAPDSGLIAEYVFDETSGTAVPNTAAGSAFGDATVERGQDSDWTGTSLTLRGGSKTGSGDYVRLPDDMLTSAESATVSIEVKPSATSLGGFHFLWNFGAQDDQTDYFFGSVNESNNRSTLVGIMNEDSETLVQSGESLTADEWVNVTSVVDGAAGTASVYINGQLAQTGPMPHTPSDIADQSFSAIGYPAWPDPLFQGEVAAFRVYDRVLDATEVAAVSAEDASIHAAEFAAQAQGVLDDLNLQDLTTADHIDLPTADGRVTWTTSDSSVVTADGTVSQPTQGQPNATAELTASVSVRGQEASQTITVTVEPSDETPAERLARLAARWVVPSVVASGAELPAAPDGVTASSVEAAGAGISLVDGAIVSSAAEPTVATVTAVLADDSSSETVTREFTVTVLPADGSRDLLAYHRNPTNDAEANNADAALSMHLALEEASGWSPLFDNYGIFFPKTSQTPASGGTTSGIIRSLIDPHVFYLEDGRYGIVATRVARNGGSDGTGDSSVLFATSDDLLSYEEVGLIDLGVTSGVNNAAAIYDSASDRYVLTWMSDTGASLYTSFASLDPVADQGPIERGIVPILGDDASGAGVANYAGGNALPVTTEVAEALEVRFEPIVNTGASNLHDIELAAGDPFSEGDLPSMIDLDYNDGSTADLGITWDAADIAAVDTSVPGEYVIEGTVRQPDYQAPFAVERADPTAFKFDYNGENKYLMIATKDLNLDPVNNGGQPTGLPLRMADSIAGLSDEALAAGEVEEVDILSRGTLDAYGNSMWGCFWAPEMHMVDGKLSIFFMPCYSSDIFTGRASIIQLEQDGEGNHLDPTDPANWSEATYVTRADGQPLNTQTGISLDMTYWEDQGTHYYSWQMLGANFIATFDPADPYTLTSTPVRIVPSEYAWDNTIAEGPNVHIKDGTVYMLYSGSLVGNTYTNGLVMAPSGADLTDPSVWTKLNYPILKSEPFEDDWLLGPGHGMWSEDDDGNLLYVFHARTDAGGTGRDMYIRRVHWASDGIPRLNLEREEELLPSLRNVSITVTVAEEATVVEFVDVAGSEHAAGIAWLAAEGISTGWETETGTEFRPFASITRDAMAAFLYRYAGSPDVTLPAQSPFVDADPSLEHYEAIVWLAQEGISTGWMVSGEQEFRPFEPITRDAMAAFLYRMADEPAGNDPVESPFLDITTRNTEFYTEITWLEGAGVTEGWAVDGGYEFRPFNETTRDAMATFLYRFDQLDSQ